MNGGTTIYFKDQVTAETLRRMGGWKKFCSMLISEEPFIKKEFIENYKMIKKSGKKDFDQCLIGRYGYDNIKFVGYDEDKDRLLIEGIREEILTGNKNEENALKRLTGN